MKIWHILMGIWFLALGFMLLNHFHRQNIERLKKRHG